MHRPTQGTDDDGEQYRECGGCGARTTAGPREDWACAICGLLGVEVELAVWRLLAAQRWTAERATA